MVISNRLARKCFTAQDRGIAYEINGHATTKAVLV